MFQMLRDWFHFQILHTPTAGASTALVPGADTSHTTGYPRTHVTVTSAYNVTWKNGTVKQWRPDSWLTNPRCTSGAVTSTLPEVLLAQRHKRTDVSQRQQKGREARQKGNETGHDNRDRYYPLWSGTFVSIHATREPFLGFLVRDWCYLRF